MFPYFNEDPHSPVREERRGWGRDAERRCEKRRGKAEERIVLGEEVEKKRGGERERMGESLY